MSPRLFAFLRDLAENNDRGWFAANRERYEREVREPAVEFILEMGPRLDRISPHFTADPRRSMFRIHRDTRFSKDKSPYKTHVGIQFRHAAGRDAHAPGFYLHLEPGQCFAGVGTWRPDAPSLRAIREAIAADPARWRRAMGGKSFARTWRLGGESLKRPPAGFPADHPLVEDLKRKDFIAMAPLTQKQVTSPGFADDYARLCRDAKPFMQFLCDAVGVPA